MDADTVEAIEPAESGDPRVDTLVRGLDGEQWRSWSLLRLCTDLVSALEAWHADLDASDPDLWRLDDV